jgi:hypothetical protein
MGTRPSLRPLFFSGQTIEANLGRYVPRDREAVFGKSRAIERLVKPLVGRTVPSRKYGFCLGPPEAADIASLRPQ